LPRKVDLLSHYVSQTEIVETQLARKMRLILPQIARNRHYDLGPLVSFRATGIEMRYVKGYGFDIQLGCIGAVGTSMNISIDHLIILTRAI